MSGAENKQPPSETAESTCHKEVQGNWDLDKSSEIVNDHLQLHENDKEETNIEKSVSTTNANLATDNIHDQEGVSFWSKITWGPTEAKTQSPCTMSMSKSESEESKPSSCCGEKDQKFNTVLDPDQIVEKTSASVDHHDGIKNSDCGSISAVTSNVATCVTPATIGTESPTPSEENKSICHEQLEGNKKLSISLSDSDQIIQGSKMSEIDGHCGNKEVGGDGTENTISNTGNKQEGLNVSACLNGTESSHPSHTGVNHSDRNLIVQIEGLENKIEDCTPTVSSNFTSDKSEDMECDCDVVAASESETLPPTFLSRNEEIKHHNAENSTGFFFTNPNGDIDFDSESDDTEEKGKRTTKDKIEDSVPVFDKIIFSRPNIDLSPAVGMTSYRNKALVQYSDSESESESSTSSESDHDLNLASGSSTDNGEEDSCDSGHDSDDEEKICRSKSEKDVSYSYRTHGELFPEELPPLDYLTISAGEDVVLEPIGTVTGIVDVLVVIKAIDNSPALYDDTVIFLENRKPLGLIFETLGTVEKPFYSVRFNSPQDIESKGIQIDDKVMFAPKASSYTKYVFLAELKKAKGDDASWKHDNAAPFEELHYSDDDEEREAVKALRRAKWREERIRRRQEARGKKKKRSGKKTKKAEDEPEPDRSLLLQGHLNRNPFDKSTSSGSQKEQTDRPQKRKSSTTFVMVNANRPLEMTASNPWRSPVPSASFGGKPTWQEQPGIFGQGPMPSNSPSLVRRPAPCFQPLPQTNSIINPDQTALALALLERGRLLNLNRYYGGHDNPFLPPPNMMAPLNMGMASPMMPNQHNNAGPRPGIFPVFNNNNNNLPRRRRPR